MSPPLRRTHYQPPPLSPEFQVLLSCIRDDAPAILQERLAAVGTTAAELLLLARYHRCTSLLYLALLGKGLQKALPVEAWRSLESAHRTLAVRQTRMMSVALEIIQALGAAGIRCLPLKGTALVAAAWPEYMPRDMWDLDLLIAPEDWPRARVLLEASGFVSREKGCEGCPWIPHPVVMSGCGVSFEPHTAPWGRMPMEPLQSDFEELWARARPGDLLDQPVSVPSPEDMIFILLAGLARDRFDTLLRSWADLRWLLTAPGWAANPGRLWEEARALRGERLLGTALRFAVELLGEETGPPAGDRSDTTAYERARPVLWRRLLLSEEGVYRAPRSALRLLAGGAGAGAEIEAAGRAGAREDHDMLSRAGRVGTALVLAGGGLAYAGRLLASRRLRRDLREEWRLLRAVRDR